MNKTVNLVDIPESESIVRQVEEHLFNLPAINGKTPVGYAVAIIYQSEAGDSSVYASAIMPLPIDPELGHMELNSLAWATQRAVSEAIQQASDRSLDDVDAICTGERHAAPTETDADQLRNA